MSSSPFSGKRQFASPTTSKSGSCAKETHFRRDNNWNCCKPKQALQVEIINRCFSLVKRDEVKMAT